LQKHDARCFLEISDLQAQCLLGHVRDPSGAGKPPASTSVTKDRNSWIFMAAPCRGQVASVERREATNRLTFVAKCLFVDGFVSEKAWKKGTAA